MITIILILVGLLLLAAGIEIYRETHHFRVTNYEIRASKLHSEQEKRKILFLSDLHNQVYGQENDPLYESVRREAPDLILIGGDMLVGKKDESCDNALRFIKRLPSICPVYYANGNHEQRMKDKTQDYGSCFQEYRQKLIEAGVHFLENESVDIRYGSLPVRISGLEIPERCYGHMGKTKIHPEEIRQRIGTCDRTKYNILLAHNPDYVEAYQAWGADLILSGHLHGGIVRIPGFRGVIAPNFKLFPKYSGGLYREKDAVTVVSRGLGNHTVRIRLFNPAELVVLTVTD